MSASSTSPGAAASSTAASGTSTVPVPGLSLVERLRPVAQVVIAHDARIEEARRLFEQTARDSEAEADAALAALLGSGASAASAASTLDVAIPLSLPAISTAATLAIEAAPVEPPTAPTEAPAVAAAVICLECGGEIPADRPRRSGCPQCKSAKAKAAWAKRNAVKDGKVGNTIGEAEPAVEPAVLPRRTAVLMPSSRVEKLFERSDEDEEGDKPGHPSYTFDIDVTSDPEEGDPIEPERLEQAEAQRQVRARLTPRLTSDLHACRSQGINLPRASAQGEFWLVLVPEGIDPTNGAEHIGLRVGGPRLEQGEQVVEHCYRRGRGWFALLPDVDDKGRETGKIVESLVGRPQDL